MDEQSWLTELLRWLRAPGPREAVVYRAVMVVAAAIALVLWAWR